MSEIGKTARGEKGAAAKRLFTGVEASALAASGAVGATGEKYGGEVGQFAGEIVGGMFEPRILVARHIPNLLNKLTGKMGSGAREIALGEKLRTFIKNMGRTLTRSFGS